MNEENARENTVKTERPQRNRNKNKPETPVRTKLLTLQLILGAVIILILFLISRTGRTVSQNIGNFYSEIKKTDMAVSEVIGTLKNAAKETFAPIENFSNEGEATGTGEDNSASPDIF